MASNGILYTLILVALVLASVYSRFRRAVSRQRVSRARLIPRAALLALAGCLVLAALLVAFSPWRLAEAIVGLAVGAAAALWGLSLTAFERTPEGTYYTPNRYLGWAVSTLFLAWLAYEALVGGLLAGPGAGGGAGARQAYDPVTVTLLFVFVGYYVCYYLGVLRRGGDRREAPR